MKKMFDLKSAYDLYISELVSLAHSVKTNCDEVFTKSNLGLEKSYTLTSSDIHSQINTIIINSANIRKLMFCSHEKGTESRKRYEMRMKRADLFKKLIEGIDIKEIKKTDVRNKLEHFDEYLDSVSLKLMDKESDIQRNNDYATYNIIVSDKEALDGPIYPIRLYVVSERTFYHMEWSINIGVIYDEVQLILDRIANVDTIGGIEIFNKSKTGSILIGLKS